MSMHVQFSSQSDILNSLDNLENVIKDKPRCKYSNIYWNALLFTTSCSQEQVG